MREFDEGLLHISQGCIFNYWGNKASKRATLYKVLPDEENLRVCDVFMGAGSLTTSLPESWSVLGNDTQKQVMDVHTSLATMLSVYSPEEAEQLIRKSCHNFVRNGKDELGYELLREYYSKVSNRDWLEFYALATSSNSGIIRFNKAGEFTVKYGTRYYNPSLQRKMVNYLTRVQSRDISYSCIDFRELDFLAYDLLIVDPPYNYGAASNAAYNEQGAWRLQDLVNLFTKLDEATKNRVKWVCYNEAITKGKDNPVIQNWIEKYNVRILKDTLTGCSYNRTKERSVEIMITNY